MKSPQELTNVITFSEKVQETIPSEEKVYELLKKTVCQLYISQALISKIYKELKELNPLINLPVNKRAAEIDCERRSKTGQ